ncbi:hypothetical protein PG988_015133 [Apiospora saccharicola]
MSTYRAQAHSQTSRSRVRFSAGLVVTSAQARVAARDRIRWTANPELHTTNADAAYAPPIATPSPDRLDRPSYHWNGL